MESRTGSECSMSRVITLVSNMDTLEAYKPYWKKKHPRARKFPIETPIHPSMNKWIKLPAFSQDNLKQAWGEYAEWLVEYHGYKDLMIEKCSCTIKIFRPTKRRYDLDNLSLKFFNDGLVKAGFIIDDDINHMNPVTMWGGYDKNNPHMILEFEIK